MKRYATLLIQHLSTIYTMMPEHSSCIHHGFLALYHDEIIALGVGDGNDFIDKDTRIIEGRGHLAIPACIDVSMCLPITSFQEEQLPLREQDMVRYFLENTTMLMKHGTLIANQKSAFTKQEANLVALFQNPTLFDFIHQSIIKGPIITPFQSSPVNMTEPFYLSCGYPKHNCLDQLLCAKWYYQTHDVEATHVLAACTRYPAQALSLSKYGTLQIGNKANILLLEGATLEAVLSRFRGEEHIQVIKEGVRLFPNILI